jgi:hypothetical protein
MYHIEDERYTHIVIPCIGVQRAKKSRISRFTDLVHAHVIFGGEEGTVLVRHYFLSNYTIFIKIPHGIIVTRRNV